MHVLTILKTISPLCLLDNLCLKYVHLIFDMNGRNSNINLFLTLIAEEEEYFKREGNVHYQFSAVSISVDLKNLKFYVKMQGYKSLNVT